MENYKVKVSSEAESKEVQELFIQLGYKDPAQGLFGGVGIKSIQAWDDMDLTWGNDHDGISPEFKELTIPQLKDMVVLKRNDPKDSTHYRGDGKEYFQTHDKERHYHFQDGEWVLSTWMNYQLLPQLKPITKEPAMKEFLAKDESGSYFLFNSEYPKASEWIEVPEGSMFATGSEVVFRKNNYFFVNSGWKITDVTVDNAKKLALGLGVGAAFVSEMINGNKLVPPDMIKKISVITGIPARELRPDLWEIFKDDFNNLQQQNNDINQKLIKMERDRQGLPEVEIVPSHTFYSGDYK